MQESLLFIQGCYADPYERPFQNCSRDRPEGHEYLCCHLETSMVGHTLDSVPVGVRRMARVPESLYVRLGNQEIIAMSIVYRGRREGKGKRKERRERAESSVFIGVYWPWNRRSQLEAYHNKPIIRNHLLNRPGDAINRVILSPEIADLSKAGIYLMVCRSQSHRDRLQHREHRGQMQSGECSIPHVLRG